MERSYKKFELVSEFKPSGDQPQAIKELTSNYQENLPQQVLLGVTGSGKTFTMANVIQNLNIPTLILAPNKTLAAQLFAEFKELFPNNAVEYFVSYYDYYQPEAYIPNTNTFIEKDSAVNDQIDRMRHSATRSLFERRDVIIVSSVSCIYGLGSPEAYENMVVEIKSNEEMVRDHLLRELVRIQYQRNDVDFHRGTFRVRGDLVEIMPSYEDVRALRVEFFGDYIDRLSWVDPLTGVLLEDLDRIFVYPGSHYVATDENQKNAIETIREELRERINHFKNEMKYIEAERIEQRTSYDLELIAEMGFCPGIENYSRHFTGTAPGEPPPTLLQYFPDQFLTIIDESHVTVPQIGGMYRGDRARKLTLVEHGFRLPSALDNRPLNFQEFESKINKALYVSATPGEYELNKSEGLVIEQIIRPTGLLDPIVEVKKATHQVDDLLEEIHQRIEQKQRVLVTTLTKKMAEDLTSYYESVGLKVKYLHSDIKTMERTEIIRDLRLGVFDVLVGINLLREGLDIPEVSLVAIMDADKEGFLRSERSLIQTIGRAARNSEGRVILYADRVTQSMSKALSETERRRKIQMEYNEKHGITPQTIKKSVKGLMEIYQKEYSKIDLSDPLKRVELGPDELITSREIKAQIKELRKKMKKLSDDLEFEEAAKVRDEIKRLELKELE
ncbi:MAG: excinuclease ABC subunit UvrB, partial [Bdellovibrionales bacterium]|nr:excinuclease ABC subunit UvrB [Bdellovibrionales bacterium]